MTRLLHLSDTHVSASGPDIDGVDALRALDLVLAAARHVAGLDAVIVSGDVADDGSAAGCRAVRERVGAFAAQRGVPHVYCTGNHDARDAFQQELGSGHLGSDGVDVQGRSSLEGRCVGISLVGGLRVITLDSLVPGRTHGVLGQVQLAWLADELAVPAPRGTVVVLHHPPLHVPSIPLVADVVLQDISDLAAVVAGTDVRLVLAGHLHFAVNGFLGDVPVSVAPGVVTRVDTTAPAHLVRGVLGPGASVVELPGDGAGPVVHALSARDDRAGEQVYLYEAATGRDVEVEC